MKTKDAITKYGSASKLAQNLKSPRTGRPLTRQAVSDWGEIVPIHHAVELAEMTRRHKQPLVLNPSDYR